MANPFFDKPILNSPYSCPLRHWELDAQGQPTQRIVEERRLASFISPIPKPKKQKGAAIPGRWAFAGLTEVFKIETDFAAEVERAVDAMITKAIKP